MKDDYLYFIETNDFYTNQTIAWEAKTQIIKFDINKKKVVDRLEMGCFNHLMITEYNKNNVIYNCKNEKYKFTYDNFSLKKID